ncbi:hypothetical protein [Streptomyces scopuliridis]|uniref:hypothetical protein n=1 Tax=Streptomyces scopuliridis TaxID=452529 RepID=UPI0007C4CD10|nr:hypothetical protein [Streptomyces scopuliridis]
MTGHGELSEHSTYSENWQRLIDMTGGVPAPRVGGDGGGAGGGAGLRHSGGPWIRAAEAAEGLRTQMGQVRAEFAAAHEGLAAGTEGLDVAAVLRTARMSWERRIETAMGECASLAEQLRAVAEDLGETDEVIAATFAKVAGGGGR